MRTKQEIQQAINEYQSNADQWKKQGDFLQDNQEREGDYLAAREFYRQTKEKIRLLMWVLGETF
jgi:hypothetical protein